MTVSSGKLTPTVPSALWSARSLSAASINALSPKPSRHDKCDWGDDAGRVAGVTRLLWRHAASHVCPPNVSKSISETSFGLPSLHWLLILAKEEWAS